MSVRRGQYALWAAVPEFLSDEVIDFEGGVVILGTEAMDMDESKINEYRKSLEDFFARFRLNKILGARKALLESIYVVYEKCGIDMDITDLMINKILSSGFSDTARQGTVKKGVMNARWKEVYTTIKELAETGG